ncbi:DUF58 domain-containing protein [Desulfonema magnum]|uniref:DUF58 n=1 Tax=Desulfonema magnum TaxID=45655 RepID=A0A975GKI3_9BACT|nr:DUF58 domain-containing protein [Desulfonema magnum]QTA84779.1 DUF58 [Desulfonema magnum]
MIVPKFRLLFWVVIVVLPFGTLITAMPSVSVISASLIAVLFIFALTDAFFAFGRLTGISVNFPQVARLSKDRDAELSLHVRNEKMKVTRVRIGLAFPREIYSPARDMITDLPEKTTSSSLSWPCKPLKQGQYILDKYYLEIASPLGFWAIRTAMPTHMEIRVYPNLFSERKNMAALFLNKQLGIHVQRQVGKGRDFEQLREYSFGDCYEDIHWKATAKRGYPVTKVYQIERTQDIYVIIDASRLSGRHWKLETGNSKLETRNWKLETGNWKLETRNSKLKTQNSELGTRNSEPGTQVSSFQFPVSSLTTILDRFISGALIMGMAAERQGDMFGVLAFSDRIKGFVKAKSGKAHYRSCRDTLYTLQPRRVTPDFEELFRFIGMHIRRRALLIFLTNLDDPVLAESFLRHIDLARRRHLVLVNMMKPENAIPLFSSPEVKSADDLYRNLGGHFLWESLRETENVLKRHGVGFSLLDNEKMSVQLLSQYLAVKQRQIL